VTDPRAPRYARHIVPLSWTAFVLIGWTGVLVPSLLRQIQDTFSVDDAAIGIWYFVNLAVYATASFSGGLLTERLGRRFVLTAAAGTLAVGLGLASVATSWPLFLLAAVPMGIGAGAVDGGTNALVLAVVDEGRGRALNLLHLFYAIGALTAPALVGQLVDRGVPWEPILQLTALVAVAVAVVLWLTAMPSGKRRAGERPATADARGDAGEQAPASSSFLIPLVLLSLAIGCYVAGEVGVSNWIVRFLDDVPVATATLGLSAFWAGLALGRLVAARYADRFPHAPFAATAAVVAGLAVVVAVVAPTTELAIAAFAVSGFASGPVFPMIVAIGGELYPHRLSATTGTLTGSAVIGGTLYPPLVGLMSARFGIGTGLLGAALLSVLSGIAILAAARARARATQPLRASG
jgi:fucose permease